MKRFLISVLVITSLSILYVYQHAELLEHSYQINSSKKKVSLLIDQNSALRYNIARLEAPARLEGAIAAEKDTHELYLPLAYHKLNIEKLPAPHEKIAPAGAFSGVGRILLSMFSLDTEAVANDSRE